VRQAVVVARDGEAGDKRLVAYIVAADEERSAKDKQDSSSAHRPVSVSELRDHLRRRLPDYMLPSAWAVMDKLPLLPNGKVDRKALPAVEGTRPELGVAYVPPRTPTEEVLADLWSQVLGVKRVGALDQFFDLGGHSLSATQLISRVRQVFRLEVPLHTLFDAPTVAGLAQRLDAMQRSDSGVEIPPIQRASRSGFLPLSFAQQRLWFLDQTGARQPILQHPLAVRLTGPVEVLALEQSLNEIVRRHEVLRTTFQTEGGKPVQVIAPEHRMVLEVEDVRGLPEAEREAQALERARAEARQAFDLRHGPLMRARLIRLGEEEHVVLLTMHHIVSDGWSMGRLMYEIGRLYEAYAGGRPSPLADLEIQYADYAIWQREWLRGAELERQLGYWKDKLGGPLAHLNLPTDRPRPAVQSWAGATESFALGKRLVEKLRRVTREEGATLFMTLLGAFQTLLYRYTGRKM